MSHRVYMARIPANVLPDDGGTSGVDLAPELSALIDDGQVLGVTTTHQLDGDLLLTVLVELPA